MNHDGCALNETDIEKIQHNVFNGLYDAWELNRLFETIIIQQKVLRQLFALFHTEPMRRASTADPIPNSQLAHFKELVAMEDRC